MKSIKTTVAILLIAIVMVSASLSAAALSPVIIGDVNKDLCIDILDLVCAHVNGSEYFESIDYDVDGASDLSVFRQKLLFGEADKVIEYAVNTEYFDILPED